MRKVILLISAALFFISGCIETELEIFLNADGSGKAIMDIEYSPMIAVQYSMYNEEAADSNVMIKEMVGQMLENDDILAWEGVDSGPTSKGGLFIKATAYFEDMGDISCGGNEMYFGGIEDFEIARTDDGKMLLVEHDYVFRDEDENKDDKKKAELTDEQVEFTVWQRSTTPLPKSDGKLLLTLDDITKGQVPFTLSQVEKLLKVIVDRAQAEQD